MILKVDSMGHLISDSFEQKWDFSPKLKSEIQEERCWLLSNTFKHCSPKQIGMKKVSFKLFIDAPPFDFPFIQGNDYGYSIFTYWLKNR